jgi:hypothetical protein
VSYAVIEAAYAMYRTISGTDVKAILAYLRTVPTVQQAVPGSQYTISLHRQDR